MAGLALTLPFYLETAYYILHTFAIETKLQYQVFNQEQKTANFRLGYLPAVAGQPHTHHDPI